MFLNYELYHNTSAENYLKTSKFKFKNYLIGEYLCERRAREQRYHRHGVKLPVPILADTLELVQIFVQIRWYQKVSILFSYLLTLRKRFQKVKGISVAYP